MLIDTNTGHVVTSGPESSVKLDVIVVEGDFNNEDDDNSGYVFANHVCAFLYLILHLFLTC